MHLLDAVEFLDEQSGIAERQIRQNTAGWYTSCSYNQRLFNTSSTTLGKYFISNRCSFSAMSSTVSSGERATLYWAIISPESHTGVTQCTVIPVSVSPASFTASCTWRPHMPFPPYFGKRAGWMLIMRCG